MKLQFKEQEYQTDAVNSVVDCFAGQPKINSVSYLVDPGRRVGPRGTIQMGGPSLAGLRNAEIALTSEQLLQNIRAVQGPQRLPLSAELLPSKAAAPGTPNLDVEMETGTGKTYVYIRTLMELHKRYGWSKFIVVVPSVAIREGVKKTFDITADHFQSLYATKPRAFIYSSSQLQELERFSSDAGVQVMVINIQAFNSSGKDNRRIYETLDDFQSRKPIDVISANRPIVIIDEPQKIGSAKSLESLSNFNPLMVLRYSATHKVEHNKVHRLDAVDAYNQKLVKKIGVRGITVKGLAGSSAYLYLESIEVRAGAKPRARLELEVKGASAIRRQLKLLDAGSNLHAISNGLEAYHDLFITDIDANRDIVELSNGDILTSGQITNDVAEDEKRRIQIREVIRAHLDKERELFAQGIKVLSLFFIDEVVKYRDYSREDTLGEYARQFESEHELALEEELDTLATYPGAEAYRQYLSRISSRATHRGYFSIDKKSSRQVDGDVKKTGDEKGQSTDTDAYDLILKNKERLLSFEEPVRFIFSHSALREGWDNPNVFVMGMLKRSDNTVSRRQEIGRGLRLCVNQEGERVDDPAIVHSVNELTVVTDEAYTAFVDGLQKEINASLSSRPRVITVKWLTDKTYKTEDGHVIVEEQLANLLYKYLVKNDYLNEDDTVSPSYLVDRDAGQLPEPTSERLKSAGDGIWDLVDAAARNLPAPEDSRKPKVIPLNTANFERREFQELWSRINHKVVYQVKFDSDELIKKCVAALDTHLKVAAMQYVIQSGSQTEAATADTLAEGTAFKVDGLETETVDVSIGSQVKYDLLGEIAEKTDLTRRTCAAILGKIAPGTFGKYRQNPEQFITEASRLINEQKATLIVEHLTYDTLEGRFDTAIFTENQSKQDFAKAGEKLRKHVYDYVVTDSTVEREFVDLLDVEKNEVAVYAKLPRGFFIPTPVGNYNPDWAIAFKDGSVRHIFFVAETKGSLSSMQLKGVENAKIECARKLFERLEAETPEPVRYDVVTSYSELLALVSS